MTSSVSHGLTVPSELDFKLADEFCAIVLGMDVLYRSIGPSHGDATLNQEGLVPINLTNVTPKSYSDWTQVEADLVELRRKYMHVTNEIRRNYMQQQIGSVAALASWSSGKEISFRERVRNFLYVNENPMAQPDLQVCHEALDQALSVRGYTGTLRQKVERWRRERMVPPQQVETVLAEQFEQSRSRVGERMFPEIEDLEMTAVVVHDVPYSGYCDYVARKMYLNGDLEYTYEALKHLACHEAFPGHATHMRIRELGVHDGSIPADAGLVITNTASSSVFEGIGDNAVTFINWETTADDTIYAQYQLLRSISGANAAHMIHEQGLSDAEVGEYLKWACFADESYIQSRLRFFKHSLRAPFIYAYWRGYEAVKEAYTRVKREDQARFFTFLFKNMLSADTVRHFV